MREIPLRRRDGSVRAYALVDDVDYERLGDLRWVQHSDGYACRWDRGADGSKICVLLHRALMGLELGDPREVDHENRNRLDCQRENLRVVPKGANQQNLTSRGSSRFRGVSWEASRSRWHARAGGEHVGRFNDEIEAARAAEARRRELFPFALPDPELARVA